MAATEFSKIFLIWRKSHGARRVIVGVIQRTSTSGVTFSYIIDKDKAREIGFVPYADFPDLERKYTQNVLEIFALRLNKPERPDIQQYYDFWEIDAKHQQDKYFMLAHTQGLLATDNFEFLADFNPIKNISFISEVCGLSHYKISSNTIVVGDSLSWKCETTNPFDKYAVKVYKDKSFIGYVKIVHNKIFSKPNAYRIRLSVKSIEANGHISRVFIKISL